MTRTGSHSIAAAQPVNAASLQPYLLQCGYRRELLRTGFQFGDDQRVPLVAFAHPPVDARSACVVILEVSGSPAEAVMGCRAVGAPVVFVCHAGELQWWKQGVTKPERVGKPIQRAGVAAFFREKGPQLGPDRVYRAKTWGRFDREHQLTFVDLGLMPLVEAELGKALDGLIERTVSHLKKMLGWQLVDEAKGRWLLQTVFWLVSGKILRDKGVPSFKDLDIKNVEEVFQRVGDHYSASKLRIGNRPQRDALEESASEIDRFSNLGLVTTEALAYVYENTLISKTTRMALGTHSTPSYLVDYILGKLAPWIEEIPVSGRSVFEPACGHAAFLVAAMRLLTELLPPEKAPPGLRRQYLRKRVHGCEIDDFALEIARLSLTLADIPNPDGWDLQAGDMFSGRLLEEQSKAAGILLTNPPFENFSVEEKASYAQRKVNIKNKNKAAEVLLRTLPYLPPGSVFGVVVPLGLLHTTQAVDLRRLLVRDFEISEICLFPDKVFTFSDMESAVIIGRRLKAARPAGPNLSFRRVREHDVEEFKRSYKVTTKQQVYQSQFGADENCALRVPDLEPVWKFCPTQVLDDLAVLGKGLEFKSRDLPNLAVTYSSQRFSGAEKGFVHFDKNLRTDELPRAYWLNLSSDVIRRPGTGTKTGISQLLLNYAPTSRGPWRLKALIDEKGHPVTSRFLTIRPKSTQYSLAFFWAVLNSPVVNAFAYTHLGKRDNLHNIIRRTPVPVANEQEVLGITEAVEEYLQMVRGAGDSLGSGVNEDASRELMMRVDARVLGLYKLPPERERELLDLFATWRRPGVPFTFDRYYPEDFQEDITFQDFLAISLDWERTNQRRAQLIEKELADRIAPEEQDELNRLQSLAHYRIRLVAPLPLRELQQLRDELVGQEA